MVFCHVVDGHKCTVTAWKSNYWKTNTHTPNYPYFNWILKSVSYTQCIKWSTEASQELFDMTFFHWKMLISWCQSKQYYLLHSCLHVRYKYMDAIISMVPLEQLAWHSFVKRNVTNASHFDQHPSVRSYYCYSILCIH